MRYLSLFSGIEAATQAWQPLGWECVAVSEIEPFPCAVLEHHYPHVPNLGDVTKITEQQIKDLGQIDLIVFGSPCQNLSVAGNRKGFEGEQSSLFYAAMEIIKYAKRHCKTRFALWENVPGAFSSNKGADFTEVVKHMAGLDELNTPTNGWGKEGAAVGSNGLLEWSVLDAQWFGLAQRRKRVFAIVDFGDWTSRPPILLERESLRGDSAPSRETRQDFTADVRASAEGKSWYSVDTQQPPARLAHEIAPCLAASMYKEPPSVMQLPNDRHAVALAFKERAGCAGGGKGFLGKEECAFTLSTVRDQSVFIPSSTVAYGCNLRPQEIGLMPELSQTLRASDYKERPAIFKGSVVRRLTPIECERLQGFPDNFTQIPYRNKSDDDCPNGVRYKALGNSMAVNVMAWIGQKIQQTQGVKVYGAKTL